MKKTCSTCKVEKALGEFNRRVGAKDGLRGQCKDCLQAYRLRNRERILSYMKGYNKANREKINAYCRGWHKRNAKRAAANSRQWREKNKEHVKARRQERYAKKGHEIREQSKKYYAENRDHCMARHKEWKMQNPEKKRASSRNASLKILYGITTADYNRMMLEQGGCCAMCGEALKKRKRNYPVDHDHSKGGPESVRGIVHDQCNRIIALLENEPEKMAKAQEFLSRHSFALAMNL